MDYKKLSKVHDAVKGVAPVSVSGKKVVDEENPLDILANSPSRVEDNLQTKYIILDSVQIEKLMSMNAAQRKKFLGKLTDSQRRHVLEEMSRIKEQNKVKDSGFSEKLAYTLLDQQLANYLYAPDDFNKENLEQVYNQYKDAYSGDTVKLYNVILNAGKVENTPENDELLQKFAATIEGPSQLVDVVSVLSTDLTEEGPELTEEQQNEIMAQAELDAQEAYDSAQFDLTELVNTAVAKFCSDSATYPQVCSAYMKHWAIKIKGIADEKLEASKEIDESVSQALNDIKDLPYVDESGNEHTETEEQTILRLLNTALEDYAGGDDTKLKELANQTVDVPTEPAEGQSEEEFQAEVEAQTDSASAVVLAKSLTEGIVDNKVIDSMKSKVPALSKFNFRVSDCDLGRCEFGTVETVVNPPLTRDEYCQLCPNDELPDYFSNLIHSVSNTECPFVKEYSAPENVPYIIVNGGQKYLPYMCNTQELLEQLQNASQNEWQKIVGSACCPLEDALHLAALTNNLAFIDNSFYKKHLNDSEWAFDTIPACLAEVVSGPGLIRMKRKGDSSEKVVNIFGQDYILL